MKKTEEGYKKKYEELLKQSCSFSWDIDLKGKYTYVSPSIKKVLGFEENEIINKKHFFELTHPEDRDQTKELILGKMHGNLTVENIEKRIIDKSGNLVWVATSGFPTLDDDGKVIGFSGIDIDITKRKKNEFNSKNLFENAITAIAIHEMLFNEEGEPVDYKFLSANQAFEKHTGLKIKDVLGKKATEAIKGIEKTKFIQIYGNVVKTGNPISFEEYSEPLKRHYSVNAYKTGENLFATIFIDITENKKYFEKIKQLSFHDGLTGLYNRRFFEQEVKRLNTKRQLPLSIIVADLNGLKIINDSHGHEKGDELLKATSKILELACRSEDIIARWGGDEFVILLPKTSKKDAETIMKRIRKNAEQYKKGPPLSIATGVATKTNQNQKINDIIKQGEDSMYSHKLTLSKSQSNLMVQSFINTLASKGFEKSHVKNMQSMGRRFGEKLEFDSERLNRLDLLITLHDLGKINIPEKILTKPGKLTLEEKQTIDDHPAAGYRITKSITKLNHLSEDILSHHERWDGTGYPRKLKGKDITYLARIISILDAYDIMKSGRPYKKAMINEQIIKEFKKTSGKQFDPDLTKIFIQLLEK